MKTRIGIIGLGSIASKVYLPLLTANEGVHIAGLASRSRQTVDRFGDKYRIAGRYDTVDALLREAQPEAVFVHSPTETHEAIVTACLQAGVHVYVDKPLAYDLAASERMAALAEAKGLLLAVGFNRRFAPLYAEAKAWVQTAGGFDHCAVSKHRGRLQSTPAKLTLYDDLIHILDLLLWLGGDAYEVASYRQRTDAEGKLVIGSGSLHFSGGAQAAQPAGAAGYFGMARQAGADLEKLELHGGLRSAEVVNLERAVWMEAGAEPRERAFGSWETILQRRGFDGVVSHFLETLREPERCSVRADLVLPSHRLVEQLHP